MGAVGFAESGLDPHAIHLNAGDELSVSYLSLDLGVWQVNDYWATALLMGAGILSPLQPVPMQLLNPVVNVRAARAVFLEAGGARSAPLGYARWNTYVAGDHVPFLPQARAAARAAGVTV